MSNKPSPIRRLLSRNGTSDRTVELLDLDPTLIDLCGLPRRPELEGRSLRSLLADPDAAWDKPAITSRGPNAIAMRTERWRYRQYPDGEELYEHEKDPMEWENLAHMPDHAGAKKHLVGLLPQKPVPRTAIQYRDLPESERQLVEVPEGRFRKPDPANYLPLSEIPE